MARRERGVCGSHSRAAGKVPRNGCGVQRAERRCEMSPTLRPSNLPKLAICACFEPNPIAGEAAARGSTLDGVFRRRIADDTTDDSNIAKDDLDAVDWAVN